MNKPGFRLSALAISGAGYPPAALSFKPGLNVVAGASNTGKSYVFRTVDYMLGAQTPPEEIPQSKGYTHCQLELISHAGQTFTLSRALAGGGAQLFESSMAALKGDTASTKLGAKAKQDELDTISAFLLGLTGLNGRKVRRNDHGEKSNLSFRDVAWLTLVDEERIITKDSPLLSPMVVERTKEKAVFGLFLTGTDDDAIVTQEKSTDRKARLHAELGLLQTLIDEREANLKTLGIEANQVDQQRAHLEASIKKASSVLATQQTKIDGLAAKRDAAWKGIQESESRRQFLGDQLKRLRLLRQHYDSDSKRLEASLEAGAAFEQLPSGDCPVCGHRPDGKGSADARLAEFRESCQAEIKKIEMLRRDLDASLKEMQAEHDALVGSIRDLKAALVQANRDIESLLQPKLEDADAKLSDLLEVQSRLISASAVMAEVHTLRSRFSGVEQALKAKVPKPKLAAKVETRTAVKFCEVVGETLKAWKYPRLGLVSFDPNRFDLTIGDQNRGSMGKGYRALTHAAMVISLMRYCRAENLPHPGLVVVDTPLNPFRGPDEPGAEKVNQEVQNAFYENLARDKSGDQVLVLENTEPQAALRAHLNYIHFSGALHDRYGLFKPLAK